VRTPKYEYDQRGKFLIQATQNPTADKRVKAKNQNRDIQYHLANPGNRLVLKNIKGTHKIGIAPKIASLQVPGLLSSGTESD
jgi:hypothetical protein